MQWRAVSETELHEIVDRELAECSDELRAYFYSVSFEPSRWRQTPYGDEGGGFWAIAADQNRVLWYNDIEDGFNVSEFASRGAIPEDQYWCNQDPLTYALPALRDGPVRRMGPPRAVESG